MTQNPDTKSFLAVPGYSRLFRRGATYYFRVGVPEELRPAVGKREILKSLRTSDFAEAKRLVAFESADADALFVKERQKLKRVSTAPVPLPRMSDAEQHRLVLEWFIGEERQSLEWWQKTGRTLTESEANETLENLHIDEISLSGGNRSYEPDDGSFYLESFLAEKGLACPKDSPEYRALSEVFRLGRLEMVQRLTDRVERRPIQSREPLFRDLSAHTPLPTSPAPTMTLGELLDRYLQHTKEHRSETTFMSYQTPARVIREVLGERTLLSTIRESCRRRFPRLASLSRSPAPSETRTWRTPFFPSS